STGLRCGPAIGCSVGSWCGWLRAWQPPDASGAAGADPSDIRSPQKEARMRLEGIHHVTCITGDVLRNVDFYTRVLGLRLVGKSVNQDDPNVYHLFYSDEEG